VKYVIASIAGRSIEHSFTNHPHRAVLIDFGDHQAIAPGNLSSRQNLAAVQQVAPALAVRR